MSVLFDPANIEGLENTTDVLADYPVTYSAWVWKVGAGHTGTHDVVFGNASAAVGNARIYLASSTISQNECLSQADSAGGPVAITGTALTPGVWTHVALTVAASHTGILYINGASDGTATVNTTALSSADETVAGGAFGSASYTFPGYIGELSIFDAVKTPAEISQLAAGQSPQDLPDLHRYWTLKNLTEGLTDLVAAKVLTKVGSPTSSPLVHPPVSPPGSVGDRRVNTNEFVSRGFTSKIINDN